ncbi:magnesium chelatase subunit D [Salinarimonas ramus]|uniref:Mg-protoporphyrin IX chelatase n=1 Tax=Salinarimonas ramus TaxID=690164 RepID=A0A917Q3V3_9HYPH|nr:magnesium chelatase subunit D [Salinarimonas ramus]GGK19365.1 Mg-protoporphyrin IX chelatase [Salinarimonas ramus]
MNAEAPRSISDTWRAATRAAALVAIDPVGLGGASLRAGPGPVRERWLALLRHLLPEGTPIRRAPAGIDDDRLLGGLDLVATLAAGRPIVGRGILAEADGGIVVLAMAERLPGAVAGRLASVLDGRAVRLEREGLAATLETHLGIVALDEGREDDERPPEAVLDRLAFLIDLGDVSFRETGDPGLTPEAVAAARARLAGTSVSDAQLAALCGAAASVAIPSLRAPLLALRAARALAALDARADVSDEDVAEAFRLVLAPRARAFPPAEADVDEGEDGADEPPPPPDDPPPENDEPADETSEEPAQERPLTADELQNLVLEAAKAVLPEDLLAQLRSGLSGLKTSRVRGETTARAKAGVTGRPAGSRPGEPKRGARLDLVSTLRAAAPWQPLRKRSEPTGPGTPRVAVRREDFRVGVRKPTIRRTTIFAVDASGSSALNRLAEAKGAVELLLAQCYVRRDRVALVAFRDRAAELVLEPTRSLARAKRALAGLAGGGATPLARGIDAALACADAVRRKGEDPAIVLLTDGKTNIGRAGTPGREAAREDALAAAREARARGVVGLVVDISRAGQPLAQEIAAAMGARYLALPYADAERLSQAVSAALPPQGG